MCHDKALRILTRMEYPRPTGMSHKAYAAWMDKLVSSKFEYIVSAQASTPRGLLCLHNALPCGLCLYMCVCRGGASTESVRDKLLNLRTTCIPECFAIKTSTMLTCQNCRAHNPLYARARSLTHQVYGRNRSSSDPRAKWLAKSTEVTLQTFNKLKVAFLDSAPGPGGPANYSVLIRSRNGESVHGACAGDVQYRACADKLLR